MSSMILPFLDPPILGQGGAQQRQRLLLQPGSLLIMAGWGQIIMVSMRFLRRVTVINQSMEGAFCTCWQLWRPLKIIKFPPGRIDLSSIQPAGFPDSRDVSSFLWPVSTWFVAGAMQANWQHALPAAAWLLAVAFWIIAGQKLFHFYPMHIEQPPRGHRGPGCMMSHKSWPFFACAKKVQGHLIGSLPRILAAQHRASTSPSGGS
jgi:hypothetical protein